MPGPAKIELAGTEMLRVGLATNRLTRKNVDFIREAVAAGLGHIDTAHLYTGGESEETIGAALSPVPDGCVVATKGGWDGAAPEQLRTDIEDSLRRLGT